MGVRTTANSARDVQVVATRRGRSAAATTAAEPRVSRFQVEYPQRGPETCIFAFGKCSQSFVCRLNAENSAFDICPGTVCLTVARAFSAQDARGTSSKLILYGTPLENTVEFVRAFAALQSHT